MKRLTEKEFFMVCKNGVWQFVSFAEFQIFRKEEIKKGKFDSYKIKFA